MGATVPFVFGGGATAGDHHRSESDESDDIQELDPIYGFATPDTAEIPADLEADHEVEMLASHSEGQPPFQYYDPVGLRVDAGDIVRFSAVTPDHTVTAAHPAIVGDRRVPEDVPPFSSPILGVGGAWLYRFDQQGVYDVYCGPHQILGMVMRIVVGDLAEEDVPDYARTIEGLPSREQLSRELNRLSEENENCVWPFLTPADVLGTDPLDPMNIQEQGEVPFRVVVKALGYELQPPEQQAGTATQVRTAVDFDPPDLPENLAIDGDGNVFTTMAVSREIRKLSAEKTTETDLDKDDTELVATLGAAETFLVGIDVDDDGTLYAVNTNFDPESESVIWSVAPDGPSKQLASLPDDAFPNGVLIDADRDRLLVSDSFRGAVWTVALDGSGATSWVDDPSLDPSTDPWAEPGTVFGANGLAVSEGVVHVANLDFGRIVRIPIEDDGAAGTPTDFVEDDSLVGADGITFDDRSTLYVSVNAQNAIRRVNGAENVETVVSGGPLDYPADVAFDTGDRDRLFIANFAFGTFQSDPAAANPALLWTRR